MSSIKFHCPHCEKAVESDEKYLGQSVNCPYCNEEIIVDYDLDDVASILDKQHSSANTTSSKHPVNSITTRPFQFNEKTQKRPTTPPPLNPIKSNSNANYSIHSKDNNNQKKSADIFVWVPIAILGLILFIISFAIEHTNSSDKTQYNLFKKCIVSLLDEGEKLQSSVRVGVNYAELSYAHLSLDGNYSRFLESIPPQYKDNSHLTNAKEKMRIAFNEWERCLSLMRSLSYITASNYSSYSEHESYRKDITKSLDEAYIHYQSAHDSLLKFMEEQENKR